jgi:hypothetical protein
VGTDLSGRQVYREAGAWELALTDDASQGVRRRCTPQPKRCARHGIALPIHRPPRRRFSQLGMKDPIDSYDSTRSHGVTRAGQKIGEVAGVSD